MPAAYGRSSILRVDPAITHEIDKLYQMIQGQIGPENLDIPAVRREISKQVTKSESRIVRDVIDGDHSFTKLSVGNVQADPDNSPNPIYGIRHVKLEVALSSLGHSGTIVETTSDDLAQFVNSRESDLVMVSASPRTAITNEEYISFRPHIDKDRNVSVIATNHHGSVAFTGTFDVVIVGVIFENRTIAVANTAGSIASTIEPSAS